MLTVSFVAPFVLETTLSILAWTQGLRSRGQFDGTPDVVAFAETLERARRDG